MKGKKGYLRYRIRENGYGGKIGNKLLFDKHRKNLVGKLLVEVQQDISGATDAGTDHGAADGEFFTTSCESFGLDRVKSAFGQVFRINGLHVAGDILEYR